MKKVLAMLVVFVACATSSSAQLAKGDNNIALRVGISNGSNVLDLGFDYDWVWKKAKEFGPGAVTAGASIDYAGAWSHTYMPVGAHVGYHFGPMMGDDTFDPFFNMGVAYLFDRNSSTNVNGDGFYFQFAAGVNYHFAPKWHAIAQLGMATSFLSVGIGHTL